MRKIVLFISLQSNADLENLRLPVYGTDDGAALRDILFTWWEKKFLDAAESGAPAIGDRKPGGASA